MAGANRQPSPQRVPPHPGSGTGGLRANAYAVLSSLYRDQPDTAVVARFIRLWEDVGPDSRQHELGPRSAEAADAFCAAWRADDPEIALQRRREFALLFLSRRSVHPYESVYLGSRKRLMDDPWLEVRGFYRDAGIEKGPGELHPEDHVAVELGFMACLAFLESPGEAPGGPAGLVTPQTDGDVHDAQRRFLNEHLIRWVPQLCHRIESFPDAPCYRHGARFTRVLVEEDHARLTACARHTDTNR